MARKNSGDSAPELPIPTPQPTEEQAAEGGSYTRCPDSGELTLVARTSHEAATEDATIDFDSPTTVDSQES